MHFKLPVLFVLLTLGASFQVGAQSEALALALAIARCPQIADARARLACYDAVQPPVGAAAATAAAQETARAAPATTAAADYVARFGLVAKASDAEPPAIESAVGRDFYGWGPNERISLQNGQVWVVIDGSSGSLSKGATKVRVRRGALGSFFIDFEGLTKAPRVQRVL